jgi:AcrR family transcriptional regulator
VLNIDLAPTIAALAGVTPGRPQDGRSLVPLLQGRSPAWRTDFLEEYRGQSLLRLGGLPRFRAVRSERFLYVAYDNADMTGCGEPVSGTGVEKLWQRGVGRPLPAPRAHSDAMATRDGDRTADEGGIGNTARTGTRRRREEVLQAAAALFAEKGFAGTSTNDIAEALGIKGGSIYYYIDSKEGLLFELMEDIYGLLLTALDEILSSDASTLEKLRRLIDLHVTGMAEHRHRGALILNEARSLTPEHQEAVARLAAVYEDGLAGVIVRGQEEGVIDPALDPKLVTKALLGAGNWINRWYREGGAWSPDDVSSQYARIFLFGLAPAVADDRTTGG